jgi:hypothetical protein
MSNMQQRVELFVDQALAPSVELASVVTKLSVRDAE